MNNNSALVITSISSPNKVLKSYAKSAKELGVDFIVIGDVISPDNFELDGCDFYSIERQEKLPYKLAKILPKRHYGRKNLGYLIAKSRGYDIIVETDDDNFPYDSFWNDRVKEVTGHNITNNGWTNIYSYFSDINIWPRGFSLTHLQDENTPLTNFENKHINCPIQQGLADENPDVDAIYRLILPLPYKFNKGANVVLGEKSWCPYNSQNTTTFKEAFPLLYLPSYCSFRMTDIWRSFVAQRICWENNWGVLFHESTVWQERNEHNLIKDFADEVSGYVNNGTIVETLENLNLKSGIDYLGENLLTCYKSLIELGLVGKEELALVEAWIEDIKQ